MTQYINKATVIAEIEKRWRDFANKNVKSGGGKYDTEISTLLSVLSFLDTLKVKEDESAFINKACEWLKNNAKNYAFVDTDRIGNVADIDLSLVQDFRNYMKGE